MWTRLTTRSVKPLGRTQRKAPFSDPTPISRNTSFDADMDGGMACKSLLHTTEWGNSPNFVAHCLSSSINLPLWLQANQMCAYVCAAISQRGANKAANLSHMSFRALIRRRADRVADDSSHGIYNVDWYRYMHTSCILARPIITHGSTAKGTRRLGMISFWQRH